MATSFVHLHNHTEYSMLDGAAPVDEMVKAAVADGQTAIGITDHGNLYGTIDFYQTCKKYDVKPILGIEAYMVDDRFSRPVRRGRLDDGGGSVEGGRKAYNHLTLIVENNQGYDNLRQLASLAFLEGYYAVPRVDWDLLSRYAGGLIATSSCLGGTVLEFLKMGQYDEALKRAARLQDVFGRDNFFIEMQDHGIPEQIATNPDLLRIAKAINAPLLATNDLHYVHRHDAEMHDALLCVQTGSLMSSPDRFRFSSDQHFLKTAAEMRHLFADIPEACDNTLWIAERADVTIEFDNNALPEFPLPAAFQSDTHLEGANRYLRDLTLRGARERYGDTLSEEVARRVDYELSVITEMGFADYFLVVWDLIRYAREKGIRVGPGRGSAAGCVIAYCLRIVDVDPIRNGLLFERFLNPSRKSMPDIDMDFDERYRGDVIRYASATYGEDHVAQIITFSTIKSRAAVRDAARVLGYPPMLGDKIAKAMPKLVLGQDLPLKACFTRMPEYEDRFADAAELRTMYETDPEVKHVVDVAMGLTDKRRQDGIHAAAVVITKKPVLDYVPIQRKGNPDEAPIVTQYEATAIEKLGLLKMDFLGLRNLAIIERTLENIKRRTGDEIDIDHVPLDDPKVFAMLQRGASIGIFQLEGDKMRQLMRRLAPTSFEDIGALVALYRPGPLSENVHFDYADRKNGRKEIAYEHPDLEAVLKETYGLMIYQEDIMRVATAIAGYTMADADDLRKACSKKNAQALAAQREFFVNGAEKHGYGRELGEALFDKIEPFGGYAFNKSHAYGYAHVAYQNSWLKANYPTEYMAALLTSFRDDKDKAALYLNDARQMGITVGVPDINHSLADYTPDPSGAPRILFGLAAVRNVGETVVEKIVAEREANGPFLDIYDFVRRADPLVLNRRTMESLIKAGAFDCFGLPRLALSLVIDEIVEVTLARRKDLSQGISTLFALMDEGTGGGDWEGTTIPIGAQEYERMVKLNFEREMLGTFLSEHPLAEVAPMLATKCDTTLGSINEYGADYANTGRPMTVGGLITEVQIKVTRAEAKQYAIITLEDLEGSMEVNIPTRFFEKCSGLLVRDAVVIAKVRVDARDDALRFSAFEMEPVALAGGPSELRLALSPEHLTPEGVAVLKEILQRHPGPSPVIVETVGTGKSFRLGPDFSVSIARVVADLRTEFGRSVIKA